MLIVYTTQCFSTTREVLTTAFANCKHWSYSPGEWSVVAKLINMRSKILPYTQKVFISGADSALIFAIFASGGFVIVAKNVICLIELYENLPFDDPPNTGFDAAELTPPLLY